MTIQSNQAIHKQANTADYDISAAFRPEISVFVSANAGAGKTSLLTNRVLSLLLHGIAPAKILCLTFTNAAAAEMSNRVLRELGRWVMADDEKLAASLAKLTGETPSRHLLDHARGLFAAVLEAPEGVRIQTIHGFSQSLLRRFPLEAGISPYFSVMDSRTEQELLKEARMRLYNRAQTEDSELSASLRNIAHGMSEISVNKLLAEIVQFKSRFQSIFGAVDAVRSSTRRIYEQLGVAPGTTLASLMKTHFTYDAKTLASLRHIISLLLAGKTTDIKTGQGLAAWLEQEGQNQALINDYIDVFVTDKGEGRKRLYTKDTLSDAEGEALMAEMTRVLAFYEAWKALKVADSSADMLRVAEALLGLYENLKRQQGQMDYDDLILTARNLLMRPGIAPWILFKLDGGVDHVLIDEAQDTSPIQWQIVTALTQEFFAGLGRVDTNRSLFVVGDEKQSIYSFQGADPIALGKMQKHFTRQINDAGKAVQLLALTRSYRSTREVLATVDSIFSHDDAKQGLTFGAINLEHIPTRLEHPGMVELWPLITPSEDEESHSLSPVSQLANRIADSIRNWLEDGMWLESKQRSMQPGDIMVLVRTRTYFVDRLVRALKRRGVPVAGHDRMKLGDNLAVQDLIALGECLLLPEDDLTLACVLKSPICNVSEDDIFKLAYGRGGASLWQRLREQEEGGALHKAFELLMALRAKADFFTPYELYHYLLDTLGARKRFTGRMGDEYYDPIDEFLGQAMLFERSHTPSLQGFLHWLSSSESEIKRDMEQSRDTVRIMTVHGAKGLQAPIVILPDTTGLPTAQDVLLWQEDDHMLPLPFWPRARRNEEKLCASLRQEKRYGELCEYRRQLYVALTRAEDQLYICGASSRGSINDNSWYHYIRQGMQRDAASEQSIWGEILRVGAKPQSKSKMAKGTMAKAASSAISTDSESFSFLRKTAPQEPTPPQPLVPSRIAADEPAAASPLTDGGKFYQRGTLIHRLLQYLPDIEPGAREQSGMQIASLYQSSLSEEIRSGCVTEAIRIIEYPPFDFLFAKGSLAEAPLAGCIEIGGKAIAVAGQIDRLHIGEKDVWIVDFKSGRAAPDDNSQIPPAYLKQMRLYQLLMARLYPEKQVHCGLLWTAAPKLTVLDKALLDETDLSTYI